MQLLEATLSFLFLLSFSPLLFLASDEKIDASLYMYELQGDVKNIIHMKGGFENITKGNEIAGEILEQTGLCVELRETDLASGLVSENSASSTILIPKFRDGNLTNFEINAISAGACE